MIFFDLLTKTNITDVIEYFKEKYPADYEMRDDYEKLYNSLTNTIPMLDSGLKLYIVEIQELDAEDGNYFDVSAFDVKEQQSYAIEFTPRDEWLGFEVVQKSLDIYGQVCFVAECLREMSYVAFDEDSVTEKREELETRAREVEDALVEKDDSKFISVDKLFEEFNVPRSTNEELEAMDRINSENKKKVNDILSEYLRV